MKKRRLFTLLLALALVLTSLAACSSGQGNGESAAPAPQATVSGDAEAQGDNNEADNGVAESGSVQHASITIDTPYGVNISPLRVNQSGTMKFELYEMLFGLSDGIGSELVPVLADGTRGEFNGYDHEAGTGVYTFYIQDNIYDHAGNHLTADDVVFSFEKTLEFGQVTGWGKVVGWEAVDETTVVMTCESELTKKGELEGIVLRCFMFTEAAYNASPTEFASDECGTGPYYMTVWEEGATITVTKYEDYWQKDESRLQPSQRANVDEITLVTIPETSQRFVALTTGTIDMCSALPADYLDQFTEGGAYASQYTTVATPVNGCYYMEPNCSSESICSDLNFRLAVMYAIDNNTIAAALGEATNTPVNFFGSPIFSDVNPEWASWDNYNTKADAELAKSYLEQSSYDGRKIVILSSSMLNDTAVLVQQMLQNIGIDAQLGLYDSSTVVAYKDDPTQWDLYIDVKNSSDYLSSMWSATFDTASFSSGLTEGFVDDAEYQELLAKAVSVNATMDDMDAFWQYTVEHAYIKGLYQTTSMVTYDGTAVTSLWLNDKVTLIPGAFTYAK